MRLFRRKPLAHPPDDTDILNPSRDDLEYRRRAFAWIQGGCQGPSPTRPWADAEERSGWTDEHGIESVYEAPQGPPPLPDPYPLSGSACYRCPPRGTDDPTCCQHKNFAFLNALREAHHEHNRTT